jgi:uncharacterized small protein (DUF1192 family)
MVFFEGAISYDRLCNMPFPELAMLTEEAQRISAQRNKK